MSAAVVKITPSVQQYDWGKIGSSSKVAQLASASGISVAQDKPYAELWMGTHPSSPSHVGSTTLGEYLKLNPHLIGKKVAERFPDAKVDGNLPFLFKVLSIEKALSIQAHPDKKMAEKLHEQLPKVYKDPNHKPELALALSPFQALCGFLPLSEIASHLWQTPELVALIPPAVLDAFQAISSSNSNGLQEKAALKNVFGAVMTAKDSEFKHQLGNLIRRYESNPSSSPIEQLVLRLHTQFPGDIGVFCAFLLNHVVLEPGEAIFLGAGEPHAYVTGDIIECMANSDNVIRAGLTPKLRDIPNLVEGLTYVSAPSSKHTVQPEDFPPSLHTTLYDPPVPEFSVLQIKLPESRTETHRPIAGPSLVIVTGGEGKVSWASSNNLSLTMGDVFFIAADTPVIFEGGLTMYRAFVEV